MRPLLLLLAACDLEAPPPGGIAIGNPPTTVRISLADATDVAFDDLSLPIAGVYLEDCDGAGQVVGRAVEIGLRGTAIEVPAGDWCAIGLVPDGDATLTGRASGGTFRFAAPLPRILLYGEIKLDPEVAFVLELAEPGWIDAAAFGLSAGDHLDIGGERCTSDPLCARILVALTDTAGLYDDDGDGTVDPTERDRGESAAGTSRDRAR